MPFVQDKAQQAKDRARKGQKAEGLEEAKEALDPQQAQAIEAMSADQLKRALQEPDLEKPANAGVKSKVVEVLTARVGQSEVDRLLAEAAELRAGQAQKASPDHPWMRAVQVWESVGLNANLVPYSADEFEYDEDSLRFSLGTGASIRFEREGRTIEFSEKIEGYVGTNGVERLEGIKVKHGWTTEAVKAIYVEGADVVMQLETEHVRLCLEEMPEARYVPGEYHLNHRAWRGILKSWAKQA